MPPLSLAGMNFSLADLRAFAAVAECLNFRAAAEALHLSQPALSRRIDKLEDALGVRLFQRNSRHVELTLVGREFEPRARQLLHDLQRALLAINVEASAQLPAVRVACVSSAVRYLLSDALLAIRARKPGLRIKLVDGGAHDVLSYVLRGEVDFGFNFIGEKHGEAEFRPLMSDPFVVVCAADHELAGRQRVRWREVASFDYLALSTENCNRRVLDRATAGLPQPTAGCEVRRISSLLGLVEAGLGVAVIPRLAVPRRSAQLVAIPLIEPVVKRSFGVVKRAGVALPPGAQAFLDIFSEWSLGEPR